VEQQQQQQQADWPEALLGVHAVEDTVFNKNVTRWNQIKNNLSTD
jgi:hypothetical protein